MDSVDFENAPSVLIEPCNRRSDGRIFRMNIDEFIEIYTSFRQANSDDKRSVGTECMNYSESASLGIVKETAQQTSVGTSNVSCQTEVVNTRKISSLVFPIQRTPVPVTAAATTTLIAESRSNTDTGFAKGRTLGGVCVQKLLEVVCRHVSKFKDLMRTVHRSHPSRLHESVVQFADHLSQFCTQLTESGRDLANVVKKFESDMAKYFETKALWSTTALKEAVQIPNDHENTRLNYGNSTGSRERVERRLHDSRSRASSYKRPFGHSPRNVSTSFHKRSRDYVRKSPSYKRARVSEGPKDGYSNKDKVSSRPQSAESRPHHVSDKGLRKRRREICYSNNDGIRDGQAEGRALTTTVDSDTRREKEHARNSRESDAASPNANNPRHRKTARGNSKTPTFHRSSKSDRESHDADIGRRKDTNKDCGKVSCLKSSKFNDPSLSKSICEVSRPPYSLSSLKDVDINSRITDALNSQSNTPSKPGAVTARSECKNLKIVESKPLAGNTAAPPAARTDTPSSYPVGSDSVSSPAKLVSKTQSKVKAPTPSTVHRDEQASHQAIARTSNNVSEVKHTLSEAPAVLSNVVKNFPYVQQPKMPSSQKGKRCGKTSQPSTDNGVEASTFADHRDYDAVNRDSSDNATVTPQNTSKKPLVGDSSDSATLTVGVEEEKVEYRITGDAFKSHSTNTAPPLFCGEADYIVIEEDIDGVPMSPEIDVTRDLPMQVDKNTSQEPVSTHPASAPLLTSKSGDSEYRENEEIEIEPGEIREKSNHPVYPKASVLATKDRNGDLRRKASSGNPEKSNRLQTFVIGSPMTWIDRDETPPHQNTPPARPPNPKVENRKNTPTKVAKQQINKQPYSRITTQITPRREDFRRRPYYYDHPREGHFAESHHFYAPTSNLNCRSTDRYHPPNFRTHGNSRDYRL